MTHTERRLDRGRHPRKYPLTYYMGEGDDRVAKVLPITAILADQYGQLPDSGPRFYIVDRDNFAMVRESMETSVSIATASAWRELAAIVNEHEASHYCRLAIIDVNAIASEPTYLEGLVRQLGPACLFEAPRVQVRTPLLVRGRTFLPTVCAVASSVDNVWTLKADSLLYETLQAFLDSNVRYPIPGFQDVHLPVASAGRLDVSFNAAIQANQIAASVKDMIEQSPLEIAEILGDINGWLARLSAPNEVIEDKWPWQRYHFPLYSGSLACRAVNSGTAYVLRLSPRCCQRVAIEFVLHTTPSGNLTGDDFSVHA